MIFPDWLASHHPPIPVASAAAVLKLADGGATVPFIARYRKEETGNLDEVAIRQVIDAKERWDEILKRQAFIVEEIERQGKLTPELKEQLLATFELTVLEDLYLPYKQKRKTKATVAREAGLEPLASWLWDCGHGVAASAPGETPETRALPFVDVEKAAAPVDPVLEHLGEIFEAAACRDFVREALRSAGLDQIPVVMVSESGASVYSASEVAREEFPELDVTIRGAISIARRLQDPLAELVKIDPRSIGVGQYQHDVSPHALKKSLAAVIDSCVNQVGVNLNTASYHLLSHVSGIGPGLARAIVEQRSNVGLFGSRADLLKIPRFSGRAFEQAAGFLRIPEAAHPLDNTGVHPERYEVLERLAARRGVPVSSLLGAGVTVVKEADELKSEVGAFTFDDIVKELEKPGRDPRAGFVAFAYRQDIHVIQDLEPGMVCPGIVTNVTNFGAFIDIGVHQDGLVHISQLADRFVKDPREVVSPGDRVSVRVLQVKLDKNQIALTMKSERGQERGEARRERPERPSRPSMPERNARPPSTAGAAPAKAPAPAKTPFNDAFAALAKLRGPV